MWEIPRQGQGQKEQQKTLNPLPPPSRPLDRSASVNNYEQGMNTNFPPNGHCSDKMNSISVSYDNNFVRNSIVCVEVENVEISNTKVETYFPSSPPSNHDKTESKKTSKKFSID